MTDEVTFLRDLVQRQQALIEQLTAPKAVHVTARAPSPTTPAHSKEVEDAILARAFDPASERACRQYAATMAARGMKPDGIAESILRGSVGTPAIEDELAGVLA